MIEFDVDMSYLLECDELDKVVLNDENGEHEPMEFVPADATVGGKDEWEGKPFVEYAEHVAKELGDECFELLECCDEPDFSALGKIYGLCCDIIKAANIWRQRKCQYEDELDALPESQGVGRSCAACPEMDNPDNYISHLQSALKWHDEHVPRPTNPRNTCVVLQGSKPPEEVLFVRDEGGVTHYLPESAGTCDGSFHKSSDLSSGRVPLYYCKDTNRSIFVEREAKVCPLCGGRIKEEAE